LPLPVFAGLIPPSHLFLYIARPVIADQGAADYPFMRTCIAVHADRNAPTAEVPVSIEIYHQPSTIIHQPTH
jgi:hypothetical protein